MSFQELWHLLTTINTVTIITFILAFATVAHMLSQRHKPSSMIAWMVIILAVPYIGVPFYIVFSGRKIDKIIKSKKRIQLKKFYEVGDILEHPVEKLLRANAIAGAVGENDVILCKDGVEAYERLADMLNRAEKSIYITTYILKEDEVTKNIIKILTKKAKEGMDVKLLIDSIGSLRLELNPSLLKPLKEAGGDYRFFMSIIRKPITSKLNLRNHRKMIIVDGKEVLSGGMNIAKEYMAPYPHKKMWVDLSFIIKGRAAMHYLEIFKFDWEFETSETLDPPFEVLDKLKYDGSIIQVVPSGPDVERDALYEAVLAQIFLSTKRVWIVSPYFIPDDSLLDALIVAKHKGVDVKIITAKISDHFFLDVARRGYLRELYNENIDILLYKTKMIHAKAMLFDDVAVMGSSNFDIRSFFYNFETASFFYTKENIETLRIWIEQLFPQCDRGIKPTNRLGVLYENIFKLMAPVL